MSIFHRWLDPNNEYILSKGGSSGGGGGAGSGVIDYPAHMKEWHYNALSDDGADTLTTSITDIMNAAIGSSPWTGETVYDPATDITAYEAAISDFGTIIAGINEAVDWDALYTQAEASIDGVVEAEITADVAAFAAELDDQILTKVYPRFEGGMRDINAVQSSAFVIGKSNIEGFRDRDVAKHSSALRITSISERSRLYAEGTNQMLKLLVSKYSWDESYMRVVVEGKRIKIVAKKEEIDANLKIDEADALWDLEVFQYGANLLSSIGGGVLNPKTSSPSTSQSVIGGGLSGAAAGGNIGGGWGALGGGILGAASGYL